MIFHLQLQLLVYITLMAEGSRYIKVIDESLNGVNSLVALVHQVPSNLESTDPKPDQSYK